jgi:hypothetical protein
MEGEPQHPMDERLRRLAEQRRAGDDSWVLDGVRRNQLMGEVRRQYGTPPKRASFLAFLPRIAWATGLAVVLGGILILTRAPEVKTRGMALKTGKSESVTAESQEGTVTDQHRALHESGNSVGNETKNNALADTATAAAPSTSSAAAPEGDQAGTDADAKAVPPAAALSREKSARPQAQPLASGSPALAQNRSTRSAVASQIRAADNSSSESSVFTFRTTGNLPAANSALSEFTLFMSANNLEVRAVDGTTLRGSISAARQIPPAESAASALNKQTRSTGESTVAIALAGTNQSGQRISLQGTLLLRPTQVQARSRSSGPTNEATVEPRSIRGRLQYGQGSEVPFQAERVH